MRKPTNHRVRDVLEIGVDSAAGRAPTIGEGSLSPS
jgi:hypothetical protein